MPATLVLLFLDGLIGDQIRCASFVIPHVGDPNDIQDSFDKYHNAQYIRL